jgi:hypothetical protein
MNERNVAAADANATPASLVARGFALFPLRAGAKVPAVARDWEHLATTSLVRLHRLTTDPGANYAVACGPSNLVVVDLDVAKDPAPGEPTDGASVLRELAAGRPLPRTFTVGGRHLYFRPPADGPAPRNTVRRLGPLIDTRGAGGYVVAPGSRVDGVDYTILDDAPIAELPAWIAALLRPLEDRPSSGEPLPLSTALGPVRTRLSGAYARSALEREAARVASAPVGTRNDTLNRAAYNLGTLVGGGLLDRALAETELARAAQAAGLAERETASTLRSGLTAGMARPRRTAGVRPAAAATGLGLARAARPAPTGSRPEARQLSLVDVAGQGDNGSAYGSDSGGSGASASGNGNGRGRGYAPSTAVGAAVGALIPVADAVRSAPWSAEFAGHRGLAEAAQALECELTSLAPGLAAPEVAPAQPSPEPSTGEGRSRSAAANPVGVAGLVALLDDLDAAYDLAARAAGPVAGSARWRAVRALEDALRDLRDELGDAAARRGGDERAGTGAALPGPALGRVRVLSATAARQVVVLAKELVAGLGPDGRSPSPLGIALHRLQRAAETLATFADEPPAGGPGPILAPARIAVGRGALQARLAAMRREMRAVTEAGHPLPTAAAG